MSAISPVASLSQIRYHWHSDQPATLAFDRLTIRPQEHLFIKGPSGSGKSTLLGLLTGILTPQQGRVEILGEAITSLKPSRRDRFRADHIGYIFQQFNLLPYLSVIDNVTLPCHFSPLRRSRLSDSPRDTARQLLDRLHLPASLLDKPITELSIGQQQRVAAARALIGQPELLIADEPTSALDHDNRSAFIQLLMEQAARADATLVFVSHDPTLEPMFDRAIDLTQLNQQAVTARGGK